MFEAPELLASYAAGIRQISGAVSTSLFVRPALSTEGTGILVADGGESPPEHASVETAMQAATAHADSRGWFASGGLSYVRSSDPHSVLIPLHPRERATSGPEGEHRRKGDAYDASLGDEPIGWLGLRLTPGPGDVGERLIAKDLAAALADQPRRALWWRWLFEIGSYLAIHASQESVLLRDPVTGALSRVVFQGALVSYLRRATIGSRPLTLLFLNPDEFGAVNQRLGREAADEALREIVDRLRSSIRSTDVLARYGGAIYTILLPDTSTAEAGVVVQKIVRAIGEAPFGDGSLRLRLSVGVAGFEPGDPPPAAMELIRRADRALNAAKRQGGGRIVEWGERVEFEGSGHFDRLTGIFTGNLVRDYRNMVLLWDAVNVMAASDDADTLGRRVVEKLFQAFRPLSVAFIAPTDEGKPRLAAGLLRSLEDPERSVPARHAEFGAHRWGFIARAFGDADTSAEWIDPPNAGDRTFAQFVPMAARGHKLGGLFIDVDEPPDTFDRLFLESLAGQLAVALDRARLAHGERRRNEDEGRLLRAELSGLRQALQRAKLEYRSPQMERALSVVRRVAPTDATVLITGESGTGKELLARTVHELSLRHDEPWVVVDCSTIAQNLIDGELFGVENGAAAHGRPARLAEADGGTVLLDEISDLGVEVQGKVLRFLQEKQIPSAGGSKPRPVDVRVIAATHRDLEQEVVLGRFRADLYHRLNVVKVEVPPLRQRPEDVRHLAQHFVATHAALHHKRVDGFAPGVLDRMVGYSWPGNVRELQSRIMRAVILSEGPEVAFEALGLPEEPEGGAAVGEPAEPEAAPRPPGRTALRGALGEAVATLGDRSPTPPLGKWLSSDLVILADDRGSRISRRSANLLGIPETTFRRLLKKARDEEARGFAERPDAWTPVQASLGPFLDATGAEARCDRLVAAESLLLQAISDQFPGLDAMGAALLGVTLPTYRKRSAAALR